MLEGLISLGKNAFLGCTGLREIEIPETVTHLGEGVFGGCESLEKIVLHEGLVEIGSKTFSGCIGLKEIVIPSSVKKIAKDAFWGCEGLVITVDITEDEKPLGFASGWNGNAEVIWKSEELTPDDDAE